MKNNYSNYFKVLGALCLLLLISGVSWAQYTVKGTVRDEASKTALPGVNIIVKGTNTGAITDALGNFQIAINNNDKATLVFTFIGYLSQNVEVSPSKTNVEIILVEDVTKLEEVVVTGLASDIKRSNLANAVSTVSAKELIGTTQIQTVDNALYGKLTGVNINTNGGAPGGGVSVQLRGIASLVGASQPLYIVDGVYINNATNRSGRATVTQAGASNQDDAPNRLADINPNDIESIEVLKGPSAAAIYGTRANAGVIIITTKRGKAGKSKISFEQDLGFARPQRLLGVDNWSEEKIRTFFPAARQAIEIERFRQSAGRTYDYEKYFYDNTALLSNTRLNISGGNDKTTFFISGALTDEDGIIRRTGFKRRSLRANIDHKLTEGIKLNVSSNYINSETDRGFTGNQNNTGASIGYNIAYVPNYFNLFPNEAGVYPINPYFSENPVAVTDKGINNSKVHRFIQSFNLTANLLKTDNSLLRFIAQGGLDFTQNSTLVYLPEDLQFQVGQANPGDALVGKTENLNTNLQLALTYNFNVGQVNFNSQVGTVRLNFRENSLLNRSRGLAPGQKNLRQGTVQEIIQDFGVFAKDVGVFAQQEANWNDKVIATVGVRWDKSTLNGNADKFYAFPKASLAVNVANFDFWKFKSVVNQVKPRVAYGETAGLPDFGRTFTALNAANIGGLLGSTVSTIAGNTNILPERATELEFGLDLGLFDNRVVIEATYYDKKTKNNIQNLTLSPSVGISSTPSNLAELSNKGWEVSLGGTPVQKDNIRWFTRLMYWNNRLLTSRLGIPTYTTGAFGTALGTFLIQEGVSPNTIVGTPQISPGVFTVWGNSQPDFQMSWFNEVNFLKNFQFTMLWHLKQGGDNINLTAFLTDSGGTTPGWFGDDNGDGIPNGRQRPPAPYNNAGRWVQDASYLRLREIALYYTLPKNVLSNLFKDKVDRIRIGVSGNNIFTSTKYFGYDPETSTFGAQSIASGVDIAPYPTQRRIFGHLVIDF
ncbi:SusC/RagA family TonB-linked outer membrane protein [Thermoflexibacter ruber]|uniref:TonB-linked outer membrane protein, SusC/RagA family n=1 Tax=Thermoflexibacter ruber TaxID=1003 RepID=A0A1I2AWC5_9BACT|nr:SusC/RagA family TonB-linked outer membrane protein [Thermoflexibacter ruber]SFE48251.1 TonB-linked outer membrane protein, SusC/RagA family [Thermoflexibacter ruber]